VEVSCGVDGLAYGRATGRGGAEDGRRERRILRSGCGVDEAEVDVSRGGAPDENAVVGSRAQDGVEDWALLLLLLLLLLRLLLQIVVVMLGLLEFVLLLLCCTACTGR
jgi:hypothetical protein